MGAKKVKYGRKPRTLINTLLVEVFVGDMLGEDQCMIKRMVYPIDESDKFYQNYQVPNGQKEMIYRELEEYGLTTGTLKAKQNVYKFIMMKKEKSLFHLKLYL